MSLSDIASAPNLRDRHRLIARLALLRPTAWLAETYSSCQKQGIKISPKRLLVEACRLGDVSSIEKLLAAGATWSHKNSEPVKILARQKRFDLLNKFFDSIFSEKAFFKKETTHTLLTHLRPAIKDQASQDFLEKITSGVFEQEFQKQEFQRQNVERGVAHGVLYTCLLPHMISGDKKRALCFLKNDNIKNYTSSTFMDLPVLLSCFQKNTLKVFLDECVSLAETKSQCVLFFLNNSVHSHSPAAEKDIRYLIHYLVPVHRAALASVLFWSKNGPLLLDNLSGVIEKPSASALFERLEKSSFSQAQATQITKIHAAEVLKNNTWANIVPVLSKTLLTIQGVFDEYFHDQVNATPLSDSEKSCLLQTHPENLNFLPSIKAHRSKLLLEESLSGTPDQKGKNKKSKL